jgi:hypothetical protein
MMYLHTLAFIGFKWATVKGNPRQAYYNIGLVV